MKATPKKKRPTESWPRHAPQKHPPKPPKKAAVSDVPFDEPLPPPLDAPPRKKYAQPVWLTDEFLQDVQTHAPGISRGVLHLVWHSVVKHLAQRLLVNRREVHMGWFVIRPIPLNLRWKSTSKKGKSSFNEPNLVHLKNGLIQWSVEAQLRPEWFVYMENVEKQRLEHSSPKEYMDTILAYIERENSAYATLLAQYYGEVPVPPPPVRKGAAGRPPRVVEKPPAPVPPAARSQRSEWSVSGNVGEEEVFEEGDYPLAENAS